MLTCREFSQLYEAYRTKQLPYAKRFGVSMHKAMCKHCKKYVQQIDVVLSVTHEIPAHDHYECDTQLKERLLQAYSTKYSA